MQASASAATVAAADSLRVPPAVPAAAEPRPQTGPDPCHSAAATRLCLSRVPSTPVPPSDRAAPSEVWPATHGPESSPQETPADTAQVRSAADEDAQDGFR